MRSMTWRPVLLSCINKIDQQTTAKQTTSQDCGLLCKNMTKDPLYLHHLSSVPLQEEGLRPRSQLLLLESKLPASNHSIYKFIAILESRMVSIHNVLHVIVTNYCFRFSSAASSVKTLGLPSDQILTSTWRLLPINFVLSTLEMCWKKELEC